MVKLEISCQFLEKKTIHFSFNHTSEQKPQNLEDVGTSKSEAKTQNVYNGYNTKIKLSLMPSRFVKQELYYVYQNNSCSLGRVLHVE